MNPSLPAVIQVWRRATADRLPPEVVRIDVTSRGPEPWVRFSPFYPHGGIPVPLSPGVESATVEGIWQGLKVFEHQDVDIGAFTNTTLRHLKRGGNGRGRVLGHRAGLGSAPRQPGEDEVFTRKGRAYLNQLMAALSLYINNQKEFEKNLKAAEKGDFGALHFVKVPFLSTSKSGEQAAKYAKGKVQEEADVRTEGTVGRIHVYVAPLSAMVEMGAVDIVESHEKTVYVCLWRFGEQEVSLMGSIPAALLRGQTLVKATDADEAAGARAEEIAGQEAKQYGGLRPYSTRQD